MELATAYISVVAETSGIPRQIRGALGQARRDADVTGRGVGQSFASSFGSSMKGVAAVAGVTGGIAAVGAAMKSAISSGMDFTTSLNTMQAVAGASSDQVAKVGQVARQLGTDNQLAATSSTDAAQAMLELAKGGFSVDQSMQAARGTLQLAAAAQISAGDAATIQSQALQAFGKDATYAGTTADILANAANQSSAEITDVAFALQQGGAVANQFGVSMQDSAATIALLANAGIKGSDAGTLMKSALLALTDTTDKQSNAAAKLGFELDGNGVKFKGMQDLFSTLGAARKRMTAEDYNAASAILFGSDAMRLAGVAGQQGGEGFAKIAQAMGQSGSAAQVAAAKMQGLPGAWERFKNSAQDAGLAFYDAVKGPLTAAANWGADAIGKLVDGVSGAGPKLRDTWQSVTQAFQSAGGMDAVADWGGRVKDVFSSLWSTITALTPVIGNFGEMFAQATAVVSAVGIETFVNALEATAGILSASVVPVLQLSNDALSSMRPLVVAAVAAWLGFKLVGPALAALRGQVTSLTGTSNSATTAIRNFARQNTLLANGAADSRTRLMALAGVAQASNGRFQNLTGQFISNAEAQRRMAQAASTALPVMGRFGTAVGQIGERVGVIGRMQSSFVNATAGASTFGRTAGAAAAAGTGLRAAGAGIAGVFGGPVGLALTGAVIAGGAWASSAQRQKSLTEDYNASLRSLAEEQKNTNSLLLESRGALTGEVYSSLTKQVDDYRDSVNTAAKADAKWTDVAGEALSSDVSALWGGGSAAKEMDAAAKKAQEARNAISDLGMTSQQIGALVAGGSGQWATFKSSLLSAGEGGRSAANNLQGIRDQILQQQNIASRVAPGMSQLGEAMRVMGEKGASAGDKLNALKAAMDAMNPARNKTEAMAQYGEAIRKAAEAAQGINGTAFDQSGNLNATSEAGATLSRTLGELAEKSAQVASNGGDMGKVARDNEAQFQALANATGQPIDKIRQLYAEFGGKTVDVIVRTQGTSETIQNLALVKTAFDQQPDKKTIDLQASQITDQTRKVLQDIGATVSAPKNGVVTITTNDQASAKLALVTQNMDVLNLKRANPSVDLNTVQFAAQNEATRGALQTLQGMHPTPAAGMVIQDLLNGQAVSMSKLDELSRTTADPRARLVIDAIMANIKTVNDGLDQATRTRLANILVKTGPADGTIPTMSELSPQQRAQLGWANGGIRQYVNGGINSLESFANGKLPSQAIIQKAVPQTLVQWAEPETGGEAFIPLANGKRERSTNILATVAKMFGYVLTPQDQVPSTISGMAGALSGGAVGKLLSLSGMDRVQKFADGGVTPEALRGLAEGQGASRPLTGAPYVWGGVNFGDCSGAMSAFARMAAGLDPFGGRFSTATMGEQLRQMGFAMGRGKSGDLRFGWHNGGPGGGHTSGTLPDNTNIEMGGSNGGGMLGGNAAGSDSPQHTDHAYMTIGPSWKDAGTDPGGFVVRPDGTIEYKPGNGNFSATGQSGTAGAGTDATGQGKTSISTRLGGVVGAFVEGQIASMLGVLSINDSPGVLGAFAEYENQARAAKSGKGNAVDTTALKQSYEKAKAEAEKVYEAEKLRRKQEYEAEQKKLQDQREATKDARKRAELENKLAELKRKYESDSLAAKQKHDDATLAAKQKYDEVAKTAKSANTADIAAGMASQSPSVSDPGSSRPAPGQDLGRNILQTTGNAVKDAFRSGLRQPWQQGQPWTDTDWIVDHESSWNPKARNGKYFGLIQAGAEVYQAAGKSPTTEDPREQGQVYDKYVGDRYKDPMGARQFWNANHWYDRGGEARGKGIMQKNIIRPERVLSGDETEAFQDGVRNGFAGNSGEMITVLREILSSLERQPARQTNNTMFRDPQEYRRAEAGRRMGAALAGK